MPHLNHKGPEGKGSQSGRGLGNCRKLDEADLEKMGTGLGLRRQSGGGKGKGGRLKSSKLFKNQKKEKHKDFDSEQE